MKKYGLLHQEISVTPFTLGIIHRGFHQHLHDKYLKKIHFKNSFIAYKNYQVDWYGDLENFSDLADMAIKLSLETDFSNKILRDTVELGKIISKENQRLGLLSLEDLSNKKLGEEITSLYLLGNKICDLGQMAVFPDLRFYKLSILLKNIIKEKIIKHGLNTKSNEYYSILVASDRLSISHSEKKELLTLAMVFCKSKLKKIFEKESIEKIDRILYQDFKKEYKEIEKINNKYKWLIFGQLGPAKKISETIEELKDLIVEANIKRGLNRMKKDNEDLIKRQKSYTQDLCMTNQEKKLFKSARDFSFNKLYRYEVLLYTFYNLDRLLKEVVSRTKYTLKQLQFMSHEEIVDILLGKNIIDKEEIKKRQHLCVTVIKPGGGVKFLIADEAKLYLKNNTQKESIKDDIMVVHGSVAFVGRVFGKVRIVNSREDVKKVEEGDILVSIQTNPDLLPAMKKAAALVTDIGGITSHAAIVARELRKPCIIGTKIATQIFKDGDMVDVDATKGDIKKITS